MKILVINCDVYEDVNRAWLALYRKQWPEQPYAPVYLTNRKETDVEAPVYYIHGKDLDLGGRLKTFLATHYTEHLILITMADYLLKQRVDHSTVLRAQKLCQSKGVRHCRLRPMPVPPFPYPAKGFGKIKKQARYSLSLQPGIWETQVLYDLLRKGENPWQCEVKGSRRVKLIPGDFISTTEHVMSHHNYYRKGKPQAIEWARKNVPRDCWPEAVKGRKKK